MNGMKRQNYIQLILFSAVASLFSSCFDSEINREMYRADYDEMGRENYNIGSTLKGMQGLVSPTQEHQYQFMDAMVGGAYGGYMEAIVDNWLGKFSVFNPEVGWRKAPFADIIKELYPKYREMLNRTDDPVALALGKLLRVAVMHRVTDIYGPIPYTKMMSDGQSGDDLAVAYDSQEEVYTAMLKELDEADAVLLEYKDLSDDAFRKLDDVYYGNITRWRLYLHSLKLRMAMRMRFVKPDVAQRLAEEAVAAGVIEKNADNAMLHVTENRSAMLFNDWNDYRLSADLISVMNGYEDPRRDKMLVKGTLEVAGKEAVTDYYGVRIGILVSNKAQMVPLYSKQVISNSDPYLWMNAAEVTFLRAEGALEGWAMGGEAKDLYEQAVSLSFEERGATGINEYLADAAKTPADYTDPMKELDNTKDYSHSAVSTISIAWEEGAGADVKERNLERIITQKWIAIFPLGLEAWAEHRRTGYPRLLPSVVNQDPASSVDVNIGCRRLPYPAEEYSTNASNMTKAVQTLASEARTNKGDAAGTTLWWDVRDHAALNTNP